MHVADAAAESPAQTIPPRTTCLVLALCWVAIVSEGYDIGVMGTIVPSLLGDARWHLTPLELGRMSSAALIGTLFGSYFISLLSDLAGRKQLLIGCVALFSLSMLGAVWAPTPAIFALVRGIGGLGLGGVISVAAALTIEYSPPKRRNLNFAIMYSGFPIGALVSALSGIAFIESFGWRAVVAIGATPLLFVPVLMMWLPESLEFLVRKGRHNDARVLAARLGMSEPTRDRPNAQKKAQFREVLQEVFSRKNAMGTLCLWVAQFMAIMLVYGLGTWLPQIMRKNGYDLGSSLSFFAVFNLAAAIGGVLIGRIADRFGPRLTISSVFLVGALSIGALSYRNVMMVNYLLVACAGFGSIAVALVLLGYVANYYAPHARASGTGWAVGVGRFGAMCGPVIGGYLAGLNVSPTWNFVMFATTALLASLAVLLAPTPEHVRHARDA